MEGEKTFSLPCSGAEKEQDKKPGHDWYWVSSSRTEASSFGSCWHFGSRRLALPRKGQAENPSEPQWEQT